MKRGFASTATSLRRYRADGASTSIENWERNWMTNFPIQGTGAAIFKAAGVRLYYEYKAFDANLLIPMHDSFVFEAPIENYDEVCRITKRVMQRTFKDLFPVLNPKVTVTKHRESWTKYNIFKHISNI